MSRAVELHGLTRRFATDDGVTAGVFGMDLSIPAGTLVTLLGPSGCGKSTTLRLIAGLERADAGRIEVGGRTLVDVGAGIDVPAERRGIGMVAQSLALWPHLTVAETVAYPLRVTGVPRDLWGRRVTELLRLVDLDGLGSRYPGSLSGGQQQRVAIARALAREPDVLVLDEPFSALDGTLRQQLGEQLKEIQSRLSVTIIYVTHDRREALQLSDSIGVLSEGRLLQHGEPEQVYRAPSDVRVARMLGEVDSFRGTITARRKDGLVEVDTEVGVLLGRTIDGVAVAMEVDVLVRPESISIARAPDDGPSRDASTSPGRLEPIGSVVKDQFRGPSRFLTVEVAGRSIGVRVPSGHAVRVGDAVTLTADPDACWVAGPEPASVEPNVGAAHP